MARPVPKLKVRKPGDELTPAEIVYLIYGETPLRKEPFESLADVKRAWEQHREEILTRRDSPRTGFFRMTFPSGTRPWAYWRFDAKEDPPFEFRWLYEHGKLEIGEFEKAAELARAEWTRSYQHHTPPWQEIAARVTDEQLLSVWPAICDVDASGQLYCI